jgi:ketosteroid isomerase-like protein
MSREDVEALERVYARWAVGDLSDGEIFDPEIEVHWGGLDTTGTTHGLVELYARMRVWFEALEDVRFEAERYIDLGDQVLVSVVFRGRGRGTGIEAAAHFGHLWTFRDGRAVRLEDADPATFEAPD